MEPIELKAAIEACKNNNAIAQEKLYKHFFALMYSICKPFVNDQQAALSLINEGFLKIFANLKSFDSSKGSFDSWAKKIMTNTCIDYSRSQKNQKLIVEFENTAEREKTMQHQPKNFAREEVLYLLKRLPSTTQKVFSLYIFDGYSYKEIAEMLNMAESTSRWHVGEARKNLKKQAHKIL